MLNLLPLDPQKQKRIFMIVIGDQPGYHNPMGGYASLFTSEMEKQGFQLTVYRGDQPELAMEIERASISEIHAKYDLILYFCNVQSSGSDSAPRIVWPGLRATIPTLIHDVPMLMVSIDNPYHLMDAPRIPTYVNAYTSGDIVVKTLVEKLTGQSRFVGKSPTDAFVGLFNAKL